MNKYIITFSENYTIIEAKNIEECLKQLISDDIGSEDKIVNLSLKGCKTIDDYVEIYNRFNWECEKIYSVYELGSQFY